MVRRALPRLLSWILAASAVVHVQAAYAQAPSVVEAVAVGDAGRLDAVQQVVDDLLADDPFVVHWVRSGFLETSDVLGEHAPDARVLARAWVDLSDPVRWRLYVADGRGERFLVRVLDRGASSDEVLAESLGQILAATSRAIASGLEIGSDRSNAAQELDLAMGVDATPSPRPVAEGPTEPVAEAPTEPVAPSPTSPPGGPEPRLGVLYGAALVESSPLFQHGPGLAFGIASGPPSHSEVFVGTLSAAWLVPVDWARDGYGARFDGVSVRALATYEARFDSVVSLEASAGAGADVLRFEPRATSATALPPRWLALPIALAALGVVLRVGAVLVPIRAGVDVDLSGTRYTETSGGATATVLSPWIVRPLVQVGASWSWR